MQLILQEVGTGTASVPIIDGEVAALGPRCDVLLTRWLRHVQDDGNPVLIVVPLDPLMRVRRI